MLRVINLPKKLPTRSESDKSFNLFLKSKKQLILKAMARTNVKYCQETDDIFSSCTIRLWTIYRTKPNMPDGYYYTSIRNHIKNIIANFDIQNKFGMSSIKDRIEIALEEPIEHCTPIATPDSIIEQKTFMENIESRLSEKSAKYLLQAYLFAPKQDKKTAKAQKNSRQIQCSRRMKEDWGYKAKDIALIKEEIKAAIRNIRIGIPNKVVNNDMSVSSLVAAEAM